ncbi:TPA: tRNA CCA-pyrophosphorylase, partial [Streptococcus pneumoniae]
STMKHLTKKYFDNIMVSYTNLGEQQRIASELDLLSKLILRRQEQLEELNLLVKSQLAIQKSLEELETLKKSLMQEYFG